MVYQTAKNVNTGEPVGDYVCCISKKVSFNISMSIENTDIADAAYESLSHRTDSKPKGLGGHPLHDARWPTTTKTISVEVINTGNQKEMIRAARDALQRTNPDLADETAIIEFGTGGVYEHAIGGLRSVTRRLSNGTPSTVTLTLTFE